ncbi:MAG: hypothetical protein FWC09_10190 [Lachnospiraceae bacterium]|nr:hypothetical protein [Lachnospiraceae bacterium]
MYGTDFWKRVSLQQIGEFIRRGSELTRPDGGTLEERYNRHTENLYNGLYNFRDRVLSYDKWDECNTESEKEIVTEEFWKDIINAGGSLQELAFDIGLQAGLMLRQELQVKPQN